MKSIFSLIKVIAISIGLSQPVQAQQEYSTENKKAIRFYEMALESYQLHELEGAELHLLSALEKEPNFVEAYIVLGEIYVAQRRSNEALDMFKKAIEVNPTFHNTVYFALAQLQIDMGKYDEALNNYKTYLATPGKKSPKNVSISELNIRNAEFAKNALNKPVDMQLQNMGPTINSSFAEYFPTITVDDKTFLFTRRLNSNDTPQGYQEDFYIATKNANNQWNTAKNMGRPINTPLNEGAPSLSADGHLLFFTACDLFGEYAGGRNGFGSCDLFLTKKVGGTWMPAQNLGPNVNSDKYETQPSFSSDGRTLYFVKRVQNIYGELDQDIFYTTYTNKVGWSKPVRLSEKINTPFLEESVYIHPDGQTLYFSSKGHPGMGGSDIFLSRLQPDGSWGDPVNLGYPINTAGNEHSFLVSGDGKTAFIASNREGGYGDLDLYSFELPEHAKAQPTTYMAGKVFNAKTKEPIGAKFELINLATNQVVVVSASDSRSGEFTVALPANQNYALNVAKDGFLFYSENFELTAQANNEPYHQDVPLQPILAGESVVLKNIFFETAKFNLLETSKTELNILVQFLTDNSTLSVEIGGHTDNVGDAKSNLTLSENRAKSVYNYLIEQGIDANRLSYKGYGETKPIASNDTEEGRKTNRRTEFTITQ